MPREEIFHAFFLELDGLLRRYSTFAPVWRNWQTRSTQNRVPSGVWVRPPLPVSQKDGGAPLLLGVTENFSIPSFDTLTLNSEIGRLLGLRGFIRTDKELFQISRHLVRGFGFADFSLDFIKIR
jgi:hypothetical protein